MSQLQEQDIELAQWFERTLDRLVLFSLPILIVALILWGIGSAFPALTVLFNVITTILVLIVACVVIVRLVEIAWRWSQSAEQSEGMGTIGISLLLLIGVFVLIDMVTHAGQAGPSKIIVVAVLILILALQYRAIIVRYLSKKTDGKNGDKS